MDDGSPPSVQTVIAAVSSLKPAPAPSASKAVRGPGIVASLLGKCDEAIRHKLKRYAFVEIDDNVPPNQGYVFVSSYSGIRFVGHMKTAPVAGSEEAREYPPLVAPLQGAYAVDGYVAYSNEPIHGGLPYLHSTYICAAALDGDQVKIGDVDFRLVK
ncbi:MAG: hypothetical protein ABJC66_14205 [Gammaproteobacteria bacterium]